MKLESPLKNAGLNILLAGLYLVAAKFGLSLAFVHVSATAFWPPTGIALAAFLLFGYRIWPGIFLGAFLANLTTAGTVATSLGIALGNSAEGALGAYLVNKFAGGLDVFKHPRTILLFTVLAGGLSTTVSATVGVTTLVLGGLAQVSQFWPVWITWWLGDLGGALIFAPIFILWTRFEKIKRTRGQYIELFLLFFFLAICSLIIFTHLFHSGLRKYPFELTYTILIFWAAFRFGQRETATVVGIASVNSVWNTIQGFGLFAQYSSNEAILFLQVFTSVFSILSLNIRALLLERSRVEEELRESEERFRNVFESGALGIALIDPATLKYMDVNPAFMRLTGFSREELLKKKLTDLSHQDDVSESVEAFRKVANLEVPSVTIEKRYITKDFGVVWVNLFTSAIHDRQGNLIYNMAIAENITERKEIDQAKNDFISLASHELRSPLSNIRWSCELIIKDYAHTFDPKMKRYMDHLCETNERMTILVNTLLNVSRIELGTFPIQPKPSSLTAISDKIIGESDFQIKKKKIEFKKIYDPAIPAQINIDPALTQIILQNLLSNAVKYTGENGKITLEINKKDPDILIRVSDSGCGIPAGAKAKIFSKMFRAENGRKIDVHGIGLGLYITKAILNSAGGQIWFESEEDKGSTFYVSIPISGMRQKTGNKELSV